MRPRLFTARNFLLFFAALLILSGMAYWLKGGMQLPGFGIASTAGKIAYLSDSGSGNTDLRMMNADGSSSALLTANVGGNDAPAWSNDGGLLAFISTGDTAKGKNPQVGEMNAAPGAPVAALTQTSSSKAAPYFGPENRVFYLASGQLVATTSDGTDSDKIFPTFDEQRMLQGTGDTPGILGMGGIAHAALSPDGARLAIALKTDHGEALLLYEISSQTCILLGIGERVFASFLPDGHLVALFRAGTPMGHMQEVQGKISFVVQGKVLFNADLIKMQNAQPEQVAQILGAGKTLINTPPPGNQTALTIFDATGTGTQPLRVAFTPDAFAVSPDGQFAAIGMTKDGTGENAPSAGAYVLPLASGSVAHPYEGAVESLAFSPDSKQLALVSKGDIYTVPADGSAPAKNLTNGKGKNSAPVWSPAKPK